MNSKNKIKPMHQIVDCPNSTSSKSNSILEYKTEICKCHLGPKFHHKPVPLGYQPFQFINHATWGQQSSKPVQMYQHLFQFKVIPCGHHMDIMHTTHHNCPVLHNLSIYICRGDILDRGAEPHRYCYNYVE